MVQQSYDHRFLVKSPWGVRTGSSDHVTGAPTPPVRDSKWTRAHRAQALLMVGDKIREGPELVFERLVNHGLADEGQLKVLVK